MIDIEKDLNLEYDRAINIEDDFHRNQAIDKVFRRARKNGIELDVFRHRIVNENLARFRRMARDREGHIV